MEEKEKFYIYQVVDGKTQDDFLNIGYEKLPEDLVGDDIVVYKPVILHKEHELVQAAIGLFNNEEWQKFMLDEQGVTEFLKNVGIEFETFVSEDGTEKRLLIESDAFYEMACIWRIEVNFTDPEHCVAFTTNELITQNLYVNASLLERYCQGFIDELLDENLIVKKEVDA